jgi:glycosyltransferase involved in cell wall biosynthesis
MNVTYTIPSNPHIDGVYSYYTGLKDELKTHVNLEDVKLNSYLGFAKYVNFPTTKTIHSRGPLYPDVIHNPTSYYYLMRKQPVPLVLTIMDAIQFLQPEMLSFKSQMYHKYFGPRAVKLADHIITISEYSKKDLIKYGIPEDTLTVIYPGVNPLYFTRAFLSQAYIEQTYNITAPYVLYVGAFNTRKNIERLIITFMGAKEKYKFNYQLVLAGGSYWDNKLVYELAQRFHKDVKIIRSPSVEVLHALYSYASLFVYPSLYEGFGLPIAEAMACGCPVLCSDRSSMPEVVGMKELTFNPMQIPYEIFEYIPSMDMMRAPMWHRAREVFTWDRAAKETMRIYEQLSN